MDQEDFRKRALAEMDAVHRLAYHLADDPHEAGDYVQETYLRALKSGAGFTLTEHGLRPWLFKILHNVVSTQQAKRVRRPALVGDFDGHAAPAGGAPRCGGSDVDDLDWDGLDERLVRAIRELPVGLRTVFLLSAVEGLRYRQIADVTDLPLTTVTARLYHAREVLSARLADLAAEEGFRARQAPLYTELDGSVRG